MNPKDAASARWTRRAGRSGVHGAEARLAQVLDLLDEQVVHLHEPLDLPYPVPLQVHTSNTREEVLGAFGVSTVVKPVPLQTGVYWHEDPNRTCSS